MKKIEIFDKFLNYYESKNVDNVENVVYSYRPSMKKCIINFIISLVVLIVLVIFFSNMGRIFWMIFVVDILVLTYYGINLFTKDGLRIRKYGYVLKSELGENEEQEEEVNEDEYRD